VRRRIDKRSAFWGAGVPTRRAQCQHRGRISGDERRRRRDEVQGGSTSILDGGPCRLGIESTVIGFDQNHPILLRLGAVARDDIERILGPFAEPAVADLRRPGMMASHYAARRPGFA